RLLQQGTVLLAYARLADRNFGRVFIATAEIEEAACDRRLGATDDLIFLRHSDPRLGRIAAVLLAARQCLDARKISMSDRDDKLVAIGLQKLLHALDRIAVIIEQVADALQEIDILGPIVTSAATTLHRLDLRKPRFPEAQDMLWKV